MVWQLLASGPINGIGDYSINMKKMNHYESLFIQRPYLCIQHVQFGDFVTPIVSWHRAFRGSAAGPHGIGAEIGNVHSCNGKHKSYIKGCHGKALLSSQSDGLANSHTSTETDNMLL